MPCLSHTAYLLSASNVVCSSVYGPQQLDVCQKSPGQTYHQSAEHPEVHRLQRNLFDASHCFYALQVGNVCNYILFFPLQARAFKIVSELREKCYKPGNWSFLYFAQMIGAQNILI